MVKKDINLLGDITIIIPAKIIEKNLLKCLNICIKKYPNTPKIVMLDHLKNPPILKSTKFLSTGWISIGAKRNIGVNHVRTNFVAFLDSDAYPSENWLENAIKLLKKREIIAVGGTELDFPSQSYTEECVSKASKSFLVTVLNFRKNIKKEKYCDYLPSCNLILEKKTYKIAGGMNPNLITGEDWDFGDKLRKKIKGKILYSPSVKIFHKSRNLENFFTMAFKLLPLPEIRITILNFSTIQLNFLYLFFFYFLWHYLNQNNSFFVFLIFFLF